MGLSSAAEREPAKRKQGQRGKARNKEEPFSESFCLIGRGVACGWPGVGNVSRKQMKGKGKTSAAAAAAARLSVWNGFGWGGLKF